MRHNVIGGCAMTCLTLPYLSRFSELPQQISIVKYGIESRLQFTAGLQC